ncbi:hypothetical protein MMC09_001300 [Bachmanniomyces sp. S44760]|nr:hypothetical protein [Bachmanniomyces sp. S44760]
MQYQALLPVALALANIAGVVGQQTDSNGNPLNSFISVAGSAVSVVQSAAATQIPASSPSSSPSTAPSSTSAAPTASSSPAPVAGGLSKGAKIGIIVAAVVAALLLLFLLLGCIYCCVRRRRKNRGRAVTPVAEEEVSTWRRPSNPGRAYSPLNQHGSHPMAQRDGAIPLSAAGGRPATAEHPAFRNEREHQNPFVPIPPSPRRAAPNSRSGLTDGMVAGDPAYVGTPRTSGQHQRLRKSRSQSRGSNGDGLHDNYSQDSDTLPVTGKGHRPPTPLGFGGLLGKDHSNKDHHYGRDAALAAGGVAAYEGIKHHGSHNEDYSGKNSAGIPTHEHHQSDPAYGTPHHGNYSGPLTGNPATGASSRDHHFGRDAALGAGGVGAYEAAKQHGHHDEPLSGNTTGPGHSNQHESHLGRDAAATGAVGVGAHEAEKHHRSSHHHNVSNASTAVNPQSNAGTLGTTGNEGSGHRWGRDVTAANAIAAEAERRHLQQRNLANPIENNSWAAANNQSNRSDMNATGPIRTGHHYGRDTAAATGSLGAGTLGAEHHHQNQIQQQDQDVNSRSNTETAGQGHHLGRDIAATGALGAGALGAEHHHRQNQTSNVGNANNNDTTGQGNHFGRDITASSVPGSIGNIRQTQSPVVGQGHTPGNVLGRPQAQQNDSFAGTTPSTEYSNPYASSSIDPRVNSSPTTATNSSGHQYGRDATTAGILGAGAYEGARHHHLSHQNPTTTNTTTATEPAYQFDRNANAQAESESLLGHNQAGPTSNPTTAGGSYPIHPQSSIGNPYNDMHVHMLQGEDPSPELRESLFNRPVTSKQHKRYSTPPAVPSRSPHRRSPFHDSTYQSNSSNSTSTESSIVNASSSDESYRTTTGQTGGPYPVMAPPAPAPAPWNEARSRTRSNSPLRQSMVASPTPPAIPWGDDASRQRRHSGSPRQSTSGPNTPRVSTSGPPRRLRFSDIQGGDQVYDGRQGSHGVGEAM